MKARIVERVASSVLRAELECDAGTLRVAISEDGTELRDVWAQLVPSPEAWLALASAAEEFTAREGRTG